MSNRYCSQSRSCGGCDNCDGIALQITFPEQMQTIESLCEVRGLAEPCAVVKIRIDDHPLLETRACDRGRWQIRLPFPLEFGIHTIYAISNQTRNASDCVSFVLDTRACEPCSCGSCGCTPCDSCSPCNPCEPCGCAGVMLPEPVIVFPANGETINTAIPVVEGTAIAGNTVVVCIEGVMCKRTTADESGRFRIAFQRALPSGEYAVTAVQIDSYGNRSGVTHNNFFVDIPEVYVPAPLILSPTPGETLTSGSVIFSGNAIAGNSVSVCIRGYSCATTVVLDNGSFLLTFPQVLANGIYKAVIIQRDPAGNTSTPEFLLFSVNAA